MLSLFQQPIISFLKLHNNDVQNIQNFVNDLNESTSLEDKFNLTLEVPDANLTLDHYYSILKWITENLNVNIPINSWLINYQKNLFTKIFITNPSESTFFNLQQNGEFEETEKIINLDFPFVLAPWIIIILSMRSINHENNIPIDCIIYNLDILITNILSKKEKILSQFRVENNNFKKIFNDLENSLLDFDNESTNLLKAGNYSKIINMRDSLQSSMNSIAKVIESYTFLRKYTEAEDLITKSMNLFPSQHDQVIRDFLKGRILYTRGKIIEALKILEQASENFDSSQKYWKQRVNTVIGWIKIDQGLYSEALEIFNNELPFFEKNMDEYECSLIHSGLSLIYQQKLDFDGALKHGKQNLKLYTKWGNKRLIAHSVNNLGVINDSIGNLDKALDLYNQGLELQKELNNKEGVAIAKNNIGNIFRKKGELQTARKFVEESLIERTKTGNPRAIASSYSRLALIDQIQGNLSETKKNIEKSLELYDMTDEKQIRQKVYADSAIIAFLQGNISESINMLLETIKDFSERTDYEYLILSLNYLLKIYSFSDYPMTGEIKKTLKDHLVSIPGKNKNTEILTSIITARMHLLENDTNTSENIVNSLIESNNLPMETKIECYDLLIETLTEKLSKQLSKENLKDLSNTIGILESIASQKELKLILCKTYLLNGKLQVVNFNIKEGRINLESAFKIANTQNYVIYAKAIEKELEKLANLEKTMNEINKSTSQFQLTQIGELKALIKSIASIF